MHFRKSRYVVFLGLFVFLSFGLSAQQDFNHFHNLRAEGPIPEDFTLRAYRKISDDLAENRVEMKASREKVFLERVHYAINDLLHSGVVVYGDEVSAYVGQVADKLLAKDQVLRKKLRFYTIKSNQTNAFSTYQGIIFVTTGLVSQLTSEAELAYVLSHEIAHYTENHVVETFDYKVNNRRNADRIEALSNFSKDNEFEADKLGTRPVIPKTNCFPPLMFCCIPICLLKKPNGPGITSIHPG